MGNNDQNTTETNLSKLMANHVGYYSSILTAVITIVAFGFALNAVPISGAFCPGNCIEYPYLDTLSQFPQDYLWMFPAIFLILVYTVLMSSIHSCADEKRKIFSQTGLIFAAISAVILLVDYFIQLFVVPVSLMNGETEGISILTQYNPHGLFVVLEELGYLVMGVSFLFMALVFFRKNRLESWVRWIFLSGFFLTIFALIWISINYGIERKDRFEVAVITIDWLVLIINGILLSFIFRRQLKPIRKSHEI